jgi:hypothetical protein
VKGKARKEKLPSIRKSVSAQAWAEAVCIAVICAVIAAVIIYHFAVLGSVPAGGTP